MNLSPLPKLAFLDNNGRPAVGYLLFTYEAGTSSKIDTFTDSSGGSLNTNPIRLDYRGEANVWLDAELTYKFVLARPDDTDPPTNPIWSVDNIASSISFSNLTRQLIGQILYPVTPSEIDAGVTVVNYYYPPLYVDRYGTNVTPGTTSMAAAFQAAIDVAKQGGDGGKIRYGATREYLIDAALDCTVPVGSTVQSMFFSGEGGSTAVTTNAPYYPNLILKHTGIGFDCTGTLGVFFENTTVTTDTTTYPQIGWLLARNTDARSMQCRFTNVMVFGHFSKAIRYLYGSEETVSVGCQLFNRATDSNAKVDILTQNNIRSVSSTFTTIATGAQSSLCYYYYGCSMLMFSNQSNADVIEIDSANFGNMIGCWMACANASGGGRSLIYVNTTNGMASGWNLKGITGEASVPSPPSYGIRFGTETSASGSQWTIIGSAFPHATAILGGGHASASLVNLVLIDVSSEGVGTGGINFGGTLASTYEMGIEGGITAAAITTPNFHKLNGWQQNSGETNHTFKDSSAGSNVKGWRFRCVSGQFTLSSLDDSDAVGSNGLLITRSGTTFLAWDFTASTGMNFPRVGFNGTANIAKPTITGSRGGNAALASLLTAGANYGLWTDSTTA